jgi:hypothetical protein
MIDEQPYNGAWITDRLPTDVDTNAWGYVWITLNGKVVECMAKYVDLGTPWQPCYRPAPYLKPQRYTVRWNATHKVWNLVKEGNYIGCLPVGLPYEAHEMAQEIAKFYNEVNQ